MWDNYYYYYFSLLARNIRLKKQCMFMKIYAVE